MVVNNAYERNEVKTIIDREVGVFEKNSLKVHEVQIEVQNVVNRVVDMFDVVWDMKHEGVQVPLVYSVNIVDPQEI